ncbi:MAG: transposase [Bacteroidales bacterium]|jgi:REP element-mobilizing transposase RayT|nr:transposase [Bacteroidales bacterium]
MGLNNDKYKNKYRIPSTRLQNWDYGWEAIYFVTICTKDRIHYFGEIDNGEMKLSPIGAIADVLWYELRNHFDNIELDAFVVMPNHIHGIIAINNGDNGDVPTTPFAPTTPCESTVSSCAQQMPQPHKTIGQKRFQHQGSKTLSSIVGAYKSAVSRHAHRLGYDFSWQSRFYDNIVRNNDALNRIEKYIHNNPNNWKEDKFYQPMTESVITTKIWNKDN